jgi:hypothetical protein
MGAGHAMIRMISNNTALLLTILLASSLSQAESYPFGRLFTDDSERRVIDRLRRNSDRAPEVVNVEAIDLDQEIGIQIAPTKVKFSGYIRRADGKYAIWLDGKSDLSKANSSAISVILAQDHSSAIFSSSNADATLLPGQIWYPEQGIVKDHYQESNSLIIENPTSPQSNSKLEPKSADKLAREIRILKAIEAIEAASTTATKLNANPAQD